MPRSHARWQLGALSNDEDLRARSPNGKLLYVFLTQDTYLNAAGVLIMCEQSWAEDLGFSEQEMVKALEEMIQHRFLVADRRTHELLVRSFIRNDGIAREPNMLKQALAHARGVKSPDLRKVLAVELRRLPPAPEPKLLSNGRVMVYPDPHACADEIAASGRPPQPPSGNPPPPPSPNPSGKGVTAPFTEGFSEPQGEGEGDGEGVTSVRTHVSNDDTTAPRKRGTRLPDDWQPTADLVSWFRHRCPLVDGRTETEKFRNYWHAATGQKATKLDWPKTWRNWMLTEQQRAERRPAHLRPVPAWQSTSGDPDAAFTRIRSEADGQAASRLIGRPLLLDPQPDDDSTDPRRWRRDRTVEWIDAHEQEIRAQLNERSA